MADHAEAQQEGEWTIFALTIGVVIVSFVAVIGEFCRDQGLPAEEQSAGTSPWWRSRCWCHG